MNYLVYKLTNTVNGKIYVGCHITENVNDGYMGSGRRLGYAKKKYGEAAFKKEILKVCETADEMLAEEKRIVDEEFLKRSDVYNLNVGGRGGWIAIRKNPNYKDWVRKGRAKANKILAQKVAKKRQDDPQFSERMIVAFKSTMMQKYGRVTPDWTGKQHTEESKQRIGAANAVYQAGAGNSQYGKVWMTSTATAESSLVTQDQVQPLLDSGWNFGRKVKSTKE